MRWPAGIAVGVLALAALLGGCKREPDFEERYATANKTIVDKAKAIDAQIVGSGTPPADAGADDEGNPAEH